MLTGPSDSENSRRREKLIEHVFIGDLMRTLWRQGVRELDVLRGETDASGYDLVLELGSVMRHVQLKASSKKSKTAEQSVHIALARKPSGCVIWVQFDEVTMKLGPFLWFGGPPGTPLPGVLQNRVGRHRKRDSKGVRGERPNIRVLTKGRFTQYKSLKSLTAVLFGPEFGRSASDMEDRIDPKEQLPELDATGKSDLVVFYAGQEKLGRLVRDELGKLWWVAEDGMEPVPEVRPHGLASKQWVHWWRFAKDI